MTLHIIIDPNTGFWIVAIIFAIGTVITWSIRVWKEHQE